jgi:hypothetical protein
MARAFLALLLLGAGLGWALVALSRRLRPPPGHFFVRCVVCRARLPMPLDAYDARWAQRALEAAWVSNKHCPACGANLTAALRGSTRFKLLEKGLGYNAALQQQPLALDVEAAARPRDEAHAARTAPVDDTDDTPGRTRR